MCMCYIRGGTFYHEVCIYCQFHTLLMLQSVMHKKQAVVECDFISIYHRTEYTKKTSLFSVQSVLVSYYIA